MDTHEAPLDDEALEREIRVLAATLDAGHHRLIDLLVEFESRECWEGEGHRSCAHWLSVHLGISPGAAREQLRVGRALRHLPRTAEAFSTGVLSYSKVRAITRVGTVENEPFLLSIARYGSASHLERLIARYRGVEGMLQRQAERERAAAVIDSRRLRWFVDDDGSIVMRARFSPEQGALVQQAVERMCERLDEERSSDTREPCPDVSAEMSPGLHARQPADRRDARRADALVCIAEATLATRNDSSDDKPTRPGSDRYHVTVVVDATTLAGGDAGEGAECHVRDGPALPLDTVRRLCCDSAVSGVLERDGEILSVGRRTRAIPPSMRRALLRRDKGCRFPGCTAHRYVDGHHIRHWADGGETSLDNLVLLCTHHHRLVHEGGFTVERQRDNYAFHTPAGRRVADCGEPVSAETPLPARPPSSWGWDGTPMDWSEGVYQLQIRTRNRPDVGG